MIKIFVYSVITASLSCGAPSKKPTNIIGGDESNTTNIPTKTDPVTNPVIIEPVIPKGAVTGYFNGDLKKFYAQISRVDTRHEKTYISFEGKRYPDLVIPKTLGGSLSAIVLEGFDRDLLLVTSKIKDPNFNKYHLYILRNKKWKPVVNGFAIHKSNLKQVDTPIKLDPNNLNNVLRYYSVFNLDKGSPTGYSWLLQTESIPIDNR
tara:strand:+ start:5142 stop:5759 length:618 start_codon:yes stop_codon:yes gene_type:complete